MINSYLKYLQEGFIKNRIDGFKSGRKHAHKLQYNIYKNAEGEAFINMNHWCRSETVKAIENKDPKAEVIAIKKCKKARLEYMKLKSKVANFRKV